MTAALILGDLIMSIVGYTMFGTFFTWIAVIAAVVVGAPLLAAFYAFPSKGWYGPGYDWLARQYPTLKHSIDRYLHRARAPR